MTSLFKGLRNLFQKGKQPEPTVAEVQDKIQERVDEKPEHGEHQETIPEHLAGGTVVRTSDASSPAPSAIAEHENREIKSTGYYKAGDLIENRYKVEGVFSGSMGHVYIAQDTHQRILFAIKQPKESILATPGLFSRVVQEADAWTRLGMHPNIAYCYFVKAIAGIPHIFIEYVDGGSLEDWIADRRCADFKTGLDMAIQFCHGMERAHERGMIHRDIKPRNVLVTKNGHVKVTDFGLAGGGVKAEGNASGHGNRHGTRMGDTMGTLAYMSPEQFQDPRQKNEDAPDGVWYDSDVYSFGVCMWEMFCGRRPYAVSIGVMVNHPDPRDLRGDIPDTLRALLLKSVALDRRKRPQDFRQLKEDLNAIYRELYGNDAPHVQLELHDTTADELNNQGYSYHELGKKREARACFEAAVKANSTHPHAVFNLALLQWRAGEIDDLEALRRVRNCSNNPAANKEKIAELLAYIHAERFDPEAAREELAAYKGRYEEAFSRKEIGSIELMRSFEGHARSITSVSLGADGKYALSGSDDATIQLWDAATGECRRTFEVERSKYNKIVIVTSVSLSADGKYALSGSWDTTLKLWDISTGMCLHTFEGHGGDVNSVSLSADGRYALSGNQDNTLTLWEIIWLLEFDE